MHRHVINIALSIENILKNIALLLYTIGTYNRLHLLDPKISSPKYYQGCTGKISHLTSIQGILKNIIQQNKQLEP